MNSLRFNLNGRWVEETTIAPTTTLLRYLRDTRRLTGTKEGCAEGDCGACTVVVVENDPDGQPVYRSINSCLVLLPMLQGKHVLTVEALKTEAPHPAQDAMARALGSQCGYCTPGIVMAMFEATYRKDLDAPWKLDDQLCGNLCRCTGYRPIRQAAQQVAGSCPSDSFSTSLASAGPTSMALSYASGAQRFFTPASFDELWGVLDMHPEARFVVGGTDLSLEITKRFELPPTLVSLEGLPALKVLDAQATGCRIGSAVTIGELEAFAQTRLPPVHRMVRYFGARQIKHRGTVGGNLCTASPIGDLAPVLISLGATAVLMSRAGERRVPLESFFLSYRKTELRPKELLAAIEVPALAPETRAVAYKVSKRRELDISTVSAGLLVEVPVLCWPKHLAKSRQGVGRTLARSANSALSQTQRTRRTARRQTTQRTHTNFSAQSRNRTSDTGIFSNSAVAHFAWRTVRTRKPLCHRCASPPASMPTGAVRTASRSFKSPAMNSRVVRLTAPRGHSLSRWVERFARGVCVEHVVVLQLRHTQHVTHIDQAEFVRVAVVNRSSESRSASLSAR